MRSLTRGRLFLDGDKPFITCKARSTKNSQDARQYIGRELAQRLQKHGATKAPDAPVFAMPSEHNVADMLRGDLTDARRAWLQAAKHAPDDYQSRQQSDFLVEMNHEREHLDFHGLRHTCGAWLAMTGAHPNEVKSVMRHSSITLTMDTYGHLFPGQEADTVARFANVMSETPTSLRATGAAGVPQKPRQYTRQLEHETVRRGATQNDGPDAQCPDTNVHKSLSTAKKRDSVRCDAAPNDKATFRTRTGDLRFTKPLLYQLS